MSNRRDNALSLRSEAQLRGIVESAMDAIITVDENQRVVMFNPAAEQMFGYTQDEVLGASLALFLPERFRDVHVEHVRRFGTTGVSSRRMGTLRVVTGLRRSGDEFPLDASISQHGGNDAKFYTVILRDVTARVVAEQALVRAKEELQRLAGSAHQAREHEQHRIARELHDELGQSLTALRMMVVWVRERTGDRDAELTTKLGRMNELLTDTVAAMRRISSELRPLILDDLGLIPAIESQVEHFSDNTGVACELEVGDIDVRLSESHKTAVFRIVQEALTNVAKHARATRARIVLQQQDREILIHVSDDGVGFVPDGPRPKRSRGLVGMRERTYVFGGELRITSAPNAGTTLEIRLPLESGEMSE